MSGHIPITWKYDKIMVPNRAEVVVWEGNYFIYNEDKIVAQTVNWDTSEEETEANARLIAAAPYLLGAVRVAEEEVREARTSKVPWQRYTDAMLELRFAINDATGEQG